MSTFNCVSRWEQAVRAAPARNERPFVTAAFALSQDGCLSRQQGTPTAISDAASLELTHALRAVHDVILVGVGTVLSDDPLLTTRLVPGASPLRVVLDSQLRTPVTARVLFAHDTKPLIVGCDEADPARAVALKQAGANVALLSPSNEGVSLPALLAYLRTLAVRSVMVEGGAALLKSFFTGGWVDFVCVTQSPMLLANPEAVRLDTEVNRALESWPAVHVEQRGVDVIRAGPYQASVREQAAWGAQR